MKFSDSALANLMRCQYDLGLPQDGRRARQRLVEIVARAVNCQVALYLSVDADLSGGILTSWPEEPTTPPLTPDLVEIHRRAHPLAIRLQRQQAARAWRLSDVDGGDEFRSQPLYQRVYAKLPARRQMAIRLAGPDGALHAIAVCRSGNDFTDQERRGLELLWPSMVRYLRDAHHARCSPGGDRDARVRGSRGVILLRDDVHVELCTEPARLWLGHYFPQFRPRHAVSLPPPLEHWVRQRLAAERIGRLTPLPVREPLVQARGDRYLCVDLVADHTKREHLLVLAEEAMAAPATSMTALGLTPREREVLAWVAQGKSNPVIAQILGTSGRTVQKHLEHVFQKLGVESRTAATLRAWQASHYPMLHQA